MKLHDDGEFTALNWIKPALDATLAQAREALEAYVDTPDDRALMRACAEHLHQVQGTLRMVELYGAAMVVEDMERLADALVGDRIRQRDEGYSVLMRGMVQLPDYLERLQSGHKDIPIVLLPLLNDLRACRGENLLSESSLFSPDLSIPLPASAAGAARALMPQELRTQALRLRLGFQAALLKWFRDEGAAEHLRRLIDVLDRLRAISHGDHARRLWWVATGVIDAVENGDLEASVAVKLLFGRVDREIHRFAESGEGGFAAAPPRETTKNLLYYVAHAGDAGVAPSGARSGEIRSAYRLDTLLPTDSELQHAQGSMTGRNKSLLGTVSAAIKDDLVRVKEALDIFLRSRSTDAGELAGQVEILDRVGDTLGMLGLGVPRRVVGEQRDVIAEMAQQRRTIDEGALLDVAGALLYVEASLDDHIERLGATNDQDDGSGEAGLPKAEVRKILDVLMREAAVNLQQAKHDVIAFIESPWDHQRVVQIPRLLEEIAGALRMLGLIDAGELMTAIVRFVEVELVAHKRVPTTEQMDKLADALAAIEYYLEATREQRRGRDRILDVAREGLEGLGYWPLPPPPERAPVAQVEAEAELSAHAAHETDTPTHQHVAPPPLASASNDDPELGFADGLGSHLPTVEMLPGRDINDLLVGDAGMPETPTQNLDGLRLTETAGIGSHASGAADVVSDDDGWTEIEEEIEEEVAAEDALPGGFEGATGDEIDDDIRDVFIEEVEEELANLRQQVPVWKRDVDNFDELKAIRRSFHTLKGSGRLVGALALGEFSWKVEGLLNRVLERSVVASPAVMALVDHAVNAIPVLLSALRGETVGEANIAGIMQTADQLAAGEEAWVPERGGATRTVRRSVRRRVRIAPSGLPSFGADIRSSGNLNGETDFSSATHDLVAGPLPNIDPVLFDILQSEVASHLDVIEDYLRLCKPDAVPATEPLLRAVHTLSGAIAMVDIPTIGNVLAPLENYIKRLRGAGVVPSPDAIGALHDTIVLTRDVMQRLDARDAQLPDSTALAMQITALRDSLPETDATLAWYSEIADVPAALDEQSDESVIAAVDGTDVGDTDSAGTDVDDAPPVEIDLDDELPAPPLPPVEDFTGDWLSELGDSAEATRIEPIHAPIPADLAASLAGFELPEPPAESHEEVPAVDRDSAFEASFGVFPASIETDALDAVEQHLASAPADVPLEDDLQAALDALEVEDATADAESPAVAPDIAPRLPLGGREAPPLADDPQPDGALELIDVDDDLLDIFVQESADILDHSDTLVARLREAPHERNAMVGLQRDLHTLKGGAHMAGLTPIGDLSHAMESLVDAVSDGRLAVDRVAVESLERGFDRLHVLVQRVAQRRAIGMPTHAIARFESLVAGEDVHVSKAPVADEAAVMPAAEAPSAPEASSELEPKRPAPRHLTAMDQEEAPHAPQEMIRVRSDLLDSLVNYAGEVSIYRSRLEQQISTFRFNLVEFDQTVARLREQLRKLEIETEAQIIARFQREQQQEGVFDPLELDRFSQLQQLSRALGESVSDLVSIQGLLDDQTRQSETLLLQQSRVSSDLQEGLMRTRMVPFDSLVPNLRRTLRQAAHELGKRAQLKVDGAHGEMDRNLLERMKAPFEHMLRNALAHGIETPEAREAAGKPAEGTVNIAVSRESTEVVLRVSDDGRGMDRDAIRKQAIERGLLKPEVELPDRDLYGFVLETGFSTARELTQLAGRGVARIDRSRAARQ